MMTTDKEIIAERREELELKMKNFYLGIERTSRNRNDENSESQ